MSLDLTLFNKNVAPKNKKEFLEWFHETTNWEDDLDYNDPENASADLKAALMEIIESFPPMNGPLAPTDEEIDEDEELESRMIDYSISKDLIYASIAWSQAEEAAMLFYEVAQKYGIGLFDPQTEEFAL
jgi:hypothetical protein